MLLRGYMQSYSHRFMRIAGCAWVLHGQMPWEAVC